MTGHPTLDALDVLVALFFGAIAFCITFLLVALIKDSASRGVIAGICFGAAIAIITLLARYYEAGGAP